MAKRKRRALAKGFKAQTVRLVREILPPSQELLETVALGLHLALSSLRALQEPALGVEGP